MIEQQKKEKECTEKIKTFKVYAENCYVEDGVTHPAQDLFKWFIENDFTKFLFRSLKTSDEKILYVTCIGRLDQEKFSKNKINYFDQILYFLNDENSRLPLIDRCIQSLENIATLESASILKDYMLSSCSHSIPLYLKKYAYKVIKDICDVYSTYCLTAIQEMEKIND